MVICSVFCSVNDTLMTVREFNSSCLKLDSNQKNGFQSIICACVYECPYACTHRHTQTYKIFSLFFCLNNCSSSGTSISYQYYSWNISICLPFQTHVSISLPLPLVVSVSPRNSSGQRVVGRMHVRVWEVDWIVPVSPSTAFLPLAWWPCEIMVLCQLGSLTCKKFTFALGN